jgi:hypothetical protein
MCNCNAKSVDSPHLKIYTVMSEYKAKKSVGTLYKGGFKINWATATQEELAYAYEDLGMTDKVEKLTTKTKDEPKKANKDKKSGKKSSNKKD